MEFTSIETPEGEQGAFNQAIAYLMRLDNVIKYIDNASIEGNYTMKLRYLTVFFNELYPMMKDKPPKGQKLSEKEIHLQYLKDINIEMNKGGKNKFIPFCDAWDRELRVLMKKKGLLMPAKSDPAFALGGKNY